MPAMRSSRSHRQMVTKLRTRTLPRRSRKRTEKLKIPRCNRRRNGSVGFQKKIRQSTRGGNGSVGFQKKIGRTTRGHHIVTKHTKRRKATGGVWTCEACTFINAEDNSINCSMCDTQKPVTTESAPPASTLTATHSSVSDWTTVSHIERTYTSTAVKGSYLQDNETPVVKIEVQIHPNTTSIRYTHADKAYTEDIEYRADITTDTNKDAFNSIKCEKFETFADIRQHFDAQLHKPESESNIPRNKLHFLGGDVTEKQLPAFENLHSGVKHVVLNASQTNYLEQQYPGHNPRTDLQGFYNDYTFGPGVVRSQKGGCEFLAYTCPMKGYGATQAFFESNEQNSRTMKIQGGYYTSSSSQEEHNELATRFCTSDTKIKGFRWKKTKQTPHITYVYQTGAINSVSTPTQYANRYTQGGQPTPLFEFGVIFAQFRNAMLHESEHTEVVFHTTKLGEGVFGNTKNVSLYALLAAYESLPQKNQRNILIICVGGYSTNDVSALNRFFTPPVQVDPHELYAVIKFLQRHIDDHDYDPFRCLNETNFTLQYEHFCFTIGCNDKTYVVWIPRVDKKILNIQASTEYNQSSQNDKLGITYLLDEHTKKATCAELWVNGSPSPYIGDDDLVQVLDRLCSAVAISHQSKNSLDTKHIRVDSLFFDRNLHVLFSNCISLLNASDFTVTFSPVLPEFNFNDDSIDVGGPGRYFVSMMIDSLTNQKCPHIHKEDGHFIAKGAPFAEGVEPNLSDEEMNIYTGLGHLIGLVFKRNTSQSGIFNRHDKPLGDLFEPSVYGILLRGILQDDETDIQKWMVRQVTRLCNANTPLGRIPALLDSVTGYDEMKNIADPALQAFIYTIFSPDDEYYEHLATATDNWSHWVSTRGGWDTIQSICDTYLTKSCKSQMLPLETIRKGFKACVDTSDVHRVLKSVGLDIQSTNIKLNIQKWNTEVIKTQPSIQIYTDGSLHYLSQFSPLTFDKASLVIAAILFNHMDTSHTRTIQSEYDGRGDIWRGASTTDNGSDIRYTQSSTDSYVKPERNEWLLQVYQYIRSHVQGDLDREVLVKGIQCPPTLSKFETHLKIWLREADESLIEQFLLSISGSTRLCATQTITVSVAYGEAINWHTCNIQVDVPIAYNELDYNYFVEYLIGSLQ